MRTFLLSVIALFAQSVSMTAQVAGRIEYPYRADYEDQLVLPVGDKGLVVQSFARDTKDGKRCFKTVYYSTATRGCTIIPMWLRTACSTRCCARGTVRS